MDTIGYNQAYKFIVTRSLKSKFTLILFCFDIQAGDMIDTILSENNMSEADFISYLKINQKSSKDEVFNNIIEKIISTLRDSNSSYKIFFDVLDSMLKKWRVITVYTESLYIDRIHRDSYYSFYSGNHIETSRYCKRVLFFRGNIANQNDNNIKMLQNKFLGSMVIRPLNNGFIGRTLISPEAIFSNGRNKAYIRISKYKINYMGMELEVSAFPFLTQDGITSTCAETTILITMDYYSNRYNDYRFAVPSDISKIAQEHSSSRVVPSLGLNYDVISKILCSFGLFTTFHHAQKMERSLKMRDYLYYYVESGMPVCVNLSRNSKGHAVVCIGHKGISTEQMLDTLTCYSKTYFTSTASGCGSLIVMDDNSCPYSEYVLSDNNENPYSLKVKRNYKRGEVVLFSQIEELEWSIDCFIAPLHKRMNMNAARAEQVILELIKHEETNPCNIFKQIDKTMDDWGTKKNPLIYRLFLASSRHFRKERINDNKHSDADGNIGQIYVQNCLKVPLPQFVWVCELYDKNNYGSNHALGEIVIDATASSKLSMIDSILMISYTYVNTYFMRKITGIPLDCDDLPPASRRSALPLKAYKGNGFLLNGYHRNLSPF